MITSHQRMAVPAFFLLTGPDWKHVENAAGTVRIVVAENTIKDAPDPALYKEQFNRCHQSGQMILGYVDTQNAQINQMEVLGNVDKWYKTYPDHVDGIFLDQGPLLTPTGKSDAEFQQYYTDLIKTIKSLHPVRNAILLNASEFPGEWVMSVADFVVTWEQAAQDTITKYVAITASFIEKPPQWWTAAQYMDRIANVIFAAQSMDVESIVATTKCRGVGSVFLNDATSADYKSLPSFWHRLVASVRSLPPVRLHRLVHKKSGNHFYTISDTERDYAVANFGYENLGDECSVFPGVSAVAPFYRQRLKSGSKPNPQRGSTVPHFYTMDLYERDMAHANFGYINDDIPIAGYVFPTNIPETVLLHRYWNPATYDHFYTTLDNDPDAQGYSKEREACYVFRTPVPGTTKLHRLWSPSGRDHFYTTSAEEAKAVMMEYDYIEQQEDIFIYDKPGGSVPFYRLWKASTQTHFYTTNLVERDQEMATKAMVSEDIACYIFNYQALGTVPLYHYHHTSTSDHIYEIRPPKNGHPGYVKMGVAGYVFVPC